jgi:glycosyltransferase involved in cell wall biosynthesis
MGHQVTISSYWGLQGAPTQWEGITILPGFGAGYCSTSLGEHCKAVEPDLVVTLGDVWVLDANILRDIPIAHWLPADCRPMSQADRGVIEASGAQLIAMSQFGFDRFKDAGFDPVYWPHAIETDVFKPPEDRQALRDSCQLGDDFVIGINGANNDAIRKALPEQMLAFAKFNEKHPDSLLTLHTGVHQDGGQDLEAIAENLGIVDRIRVVDQYRYHSGLVLPSDLAEWYGAIDVLSAASFGEGFGIPIVEAQACGTPVITTKCSSMEEVNPLGIQVDGEPFWNGVHKAWWIKPYIADLADAYEQAYLNRNNVRKQALRDFASEYEASRVAERYAVPALTELLTRMEKKKAI